MTPINSQSLTAAQWQTEDGVKFWRRDSLEVNLKTKTLTIVQGQKVNFEMPNSMEELQTLIKILNL
jgi:hypothetical protein